MYMLSSVPMKYVMKCFFWSSLFIISSCTTSEYVVGSDYSYEGRFHKYRSYAFADNGTFVGSAQDKLLFEKYVGGILSSWGYSNKVKKPDFYVFYSIYYDDLNFQGYNQPNLKEWSGVRQGLEVDSLLYPDTSFVDSSTRKQSLKRQREESYQAVKLSLREGTILISFFDRRREKTVWQGYASGVFGTDKIKNERTLRSAILKVMDQFKLTTYSS